jgi:hypothetical protein
MNNTINTHVLKQLLRAALGGSALPHLNKDETRVYLGYLSSLGIVAKPHFRSSPGLPLDRLGITRRNPEIDAEIENILNV